MLNITSHYRMLTETTVRCPLAPTRMASGHKDMEKLEPTHSAGGMENDAARNIGQLLKTVKERSSDSAIPLLGI